LVVTLPRPVLEVPLDCVIIDAGQLPATYCDPLQEAADHIEALPRNTSRKALFDETCRISFDKLSVRPILEAPERPDPAQIVFFLHLPAPLLVSEATG
jgi:hypothetical protein